MSVLILVPAHNEARNLPAVVRDIRAQDATHEILIVNDGSDDDTAELLPELGVRWLGLVHRMGLGGAVRTGMRYAHNHGFKIVARLDGDGQHPAALIDSLTGPIQRGEADVVIGSRYLTERRPASVSFVRRLLHYWLGRVLSFMTGRLVTDPTSGLWAFGPEAVRLLAEHHPSGYPEAELALFLSQTSLRVIEVPAEMRERLNGNTTLTLRRTAMAMARLVLHIAVVPLRGKVRIRR